jgi:hypothetical protein
MNYTASNLITSILIMVSSAIFGQKTVTDTTFILRDISNRSYHVIYIENNSRSSFYNWWTDSSFAFHNDDSLSYARSIKAIFRDRSSIFRQIKINPSLPRNWCALHSYKGKLYLYSPSDWGYNENLMITDTTIIQYFMDGPYAYIIDSFRTVDKNTFELSVRSSYRTIRKFTINVIDWQNQIAIFDNHAEDNINRYSLMVGATKARRIPMIVNYSNSQKQKEFTFDRIEYANQ